MSDNRSTPRSAPEQRIKTLADYYNDFFTFVLKFIVPVLPEKIKTEPAVDKLLSAIPTYCSNDKNFVMIHYGLVKKMCSEESGRRSIANIIELVNDTPESQEKLANSATEIKQAAETISGLCAKILSASDSDIIENVERFCLYVDILTKQFAK